MMYETLRPVMASSQEGGSSTARKETGVVPRNNAELLVRARDKEIDGLIALLSKPTQALTSDEYLESIAKRQEAVNRFLVRGGADTVRRLFDRIRDYEKKSPIRLDLSMLEMSGRLLGALHLPDANLEKWIFTDSDITGSNLYGANLTEAVAPRAIMRRVVATGSNWENAVIPKADLSGARFIGATFENTVMTDVIVSPETNFAGALFIGTHLGRTDLSQANTVGAVFRGIR
jgi:hypothetical protein